MQGLVRSRPWGVDSVPSGRIGAGPHLSLLFREHLPHLVVTVLPPYAGAYLAGVLGILISQSQSCVMRPYWQARPGPVCAASRPLLATASVGAGPHRERQRCAEWKKPWHVFSLLLFGWGLLRLCGPGAASCARFSSCGWYPTSARKNTLMHFLGAQGMPRHRDSSRLRASKSLDWSCADTLEGAAHMFVIQRCLRGARGGSLGVPTPDTVSTRSVLGKRHSAAVGCSQLPLPGSVKVSSESYPSHCAVKEACI